jgi:tRNA(adenine34) deaminase
MMNTKTTETNDIYWLQHALQLAKQAETAGEVPVGAVLVLDDQIISEGWNRPITTCDPTAHAEIIALREGAKQLNNYRLLNTTLYVTLEPCAMCASAIVHARVQRVVFGAYDPRAGAAGSVFNIFAAKQLNHQVNYTGGILTDECSTLLKNFFQQKREKKQCA